MPQSATKIGYGLNPNGRGLHLWDLSIIAKMWCERIGQYRERILPELGKFEENFARVVVMINKQRGLQANRGCERIGKRIVRNGEVYESTR